MTACLPVVLAALLFPAENLPTEIRQVAPDYYNSRPDWGNTQRTKDRAVLLIPGLAIHPLKPVRVTRPEFHSWEEPNSNLVRTLAKECDVFSFAYAQITPLDSIAQSQGLRDAVANIRSAGYKEIVLIGHSAGGVIARLFVESYPDSGVTKVIMVSTPHSGSNLAHLKSGYPRVQSSFIRSLTPEARSFAPPQVIDPGIEMVSVVSKLRRLESDGAVRIASQWPEEIQKLGIPAVLVQGSHFEVMSSLAVARTIEELGREKLVRWSPDEVEIARRLLFGEMEERRSFLRRP